MKVHYTLIGRTFGRLTVESESPWRPEPSRRHWVCVCACGQRLIVGDGNLKTGEVASCGCLRHDIGITHGHARRSGRAVEYAPWASAIGRCHNPKDSNYSDYGARGIVVCEKWRNSFADFLADIGPRPSMSHSIDRYPNNNGNYEPGNVRWATMKEQSNNRRSNRNISLDGKTQSAKQFAAEHGINYRRFVSRLNRGKSLDDAMAPEDGRSTRWRQPEVAAC